jgi:hypothetical protein
VPPADAPEVWGRASIAACCRRAFANPAALSRSAPVRPAKNRRALTLWSGTCPGIAAPQTSATRHTAAQRFRVETHAVSHSQWSARPILLLRTACRILTRCSKPPSGGSTQIWKKKGGRQNYSFKTGTHDLGIKAVILSAAKTPMMFTSPKPFNPFRTDPALRAL